MKIGITGSIACGKSTVSNYLSQNGFKVYDADKISFSLTQKPNICYNKIIEHFGTSILDINGDINRKKLGEIVFNNKKEKIVLESIIHPFVIKEIEDIKDKLCFVEVPLLFEANLEYLFDKIIVVSSSQEKQLERLMKRNNLTEKEAIIRINSQIDIKAKEAKADYVIYNNDDLETMYKDIKSILKGII